ncbi:MAG: hypothetical protein JXQ23_09450 [Clostridia bacterium]|nr:hypothetical protein [Clostridia bacterium]
MISCTQFIPAYSEGFKYLEKRGGKKEVYDFWAYLSDHYLKDSLQKQAVEKGLRGCFDYWEKALNEEAADFTMTLDEDEGIFEIAMHHCPSRGMLNELTYMETYEDYCEHCEALYDRVLKPLGMRFKMDLSEVEQAKCVATVKKENMRRD